MVRLMKDQTDGIKKQLVDAIKAEVLKLEKSGLTRSEVAELLGKQRPFMSNFMKGNDEAISLAIPRLIQMASSLDLEIELTIYKKE